MDMKSVKKEWETQLLISRPFGLMGGGSRSRCGGRTGELSRPRSWLRCPAHAHAEGAACRTPRLCLLSVPGMNRYFQPFYQPNECGKALCVRPDVMELDELYEFPEYSRDPTMYLALRNLVLALWYASCKASVRARRTRLRGDESCPPQGRELPVRDLRLGPADFLGGYSGGRAHLLRMWGV